MEGRADANGLAAEILLLRAIRSRGDRILQNAGFNHTLTMAVLRNCLLLPGEEIAFEIIKENVDALRLVQSTGLSPLGGQTHRHQGMGGVLPVELLGSRPRVKGVYTCRWEYATMLPPWARASRLTHRRGVQRYPRRVLTFRRPRLEIRGWVRDSSNLALRQGVRLHRTSCGIG